MKPSILFYSDFPFGYHNAEAETKMTHFAGRGYAVTYVEQLGIRNPTPAKLLQVARRFRGAKRDGARPSMRVLSPKLVPPRHAPLVRTLNERWLRRQLRAATEPSETILWARFPTPEVVAAAQRERFRLVVYELVDDHEHGPGMTQPLQRRFRDAASRRLD